MGINRTKKIGFFPGNWDLCHVGHIRALKEAKKHCTWLIVGIKENNNDKPSKNQPIMSVAERAEILKAIKYIDEVWSYPDEKTLYELDLDSVYNIRFMGADHKKKKHHPVKAKIIYISRNHKYSTTNLRNKVWKIENKKRWSRVTKAS